MLSNGIGLPKVIVTFPGRAQPRLPPFDGHEPQCEVKDRVAAGEINAARYGAYVRLAEDLAQGRR